MSKGARCLVQREHVGHHLDAVRIGDSLAALLTVRGVSGGSPPYRRALVQESDYEPPTADNRNAPAVPDIHSLSGTPVSPGTAASTSSSPLTARPSGISAMAFPLGGVRIITAAPPCFVLKP